MERGSALLPGFDGPDAFVKVRGGQAGGSGAGVVRVSGWMPLSVVLICGGAFLEDPHFRRCSPCQGRGRCTGACYCPGLGPPERGVATARSRGGGLPAPRRGAWGAEGSGPP